MFWTKLSGFATVLAAALIAAPATIVTAAPAYADCGDPDQPPCTGPVPTVDQVLAIMAELTDPNIPAANKGDIVTPAFTDEQAGKFDNMLNGMSGGGMIPRHVLPLNLGVTDIQPAPNNLAGATVTNPPVWRQQHSGSGPVVLAYQDGHWMITRHTAYARVYQFFADCMKAGGPHGI
jgi:hypothetical protein